MARYTVQMTFETPGSRAPVRTTIHLSPRSSLRLIGAAATLAVTGAVQADSPADAAMQVTSAVGRRWSKSQGSLRLLSWRAHRDRMLFGRRGGWTAGGGMFPEGWNDDGDGGGSAGVREPRRPLPGPGSLSAALEEPRPEVA
jgi:hypothetical protein